MLLTDRFRLVLIAFVAVTVSLPMAWVSLGKAALFIGALLLFASQRKSQNTSLWSVMVILFTLTVFALSLIWTDAPSDIALIAFGKHSKLLEIALLVSLIQSKPEADVAIKTFLVSQAVFITTSWAMAMGIPIPWATSMWATVPQYKSVVYSTYLDQTLIFSASAAVFWHFRAYWPAWRKAAAFLAVAALINTFLLQEGKTGYVAALVVLTLAIMWEIPKKWQLLAVVLTPVVVLFGLYLGSAQVQHRIRQALNESLSYTEQGSIDTSSGFRLHAWRRSVEAIQESPYIGHGIGSWTLTVKRLEGENAEKVFGNTLTSNPHQEYLMWGVELGVGGALLLVVLVASLLRDALLFETPVMRATVSVIAVMATACLFNASLYDSLIGDFFCVALGLLLAFGLQQRRAISLASPTSSPPENGALT